MPCSLWFFCGLIYDAQCADISDACLFAAEQSTKNDKDMWRVLGTLFQTYMMGSHISRNLDRLAVNNEQMLKALKGTEAILRTAITSEQSKPAISTADTEPTA